MQFAKIQIDMWSDPEFESLTKEAKLLWIYLLSNSRNNFAGIYEISKKRMELETGINNLNETLTEVTDTLPIVYQEGINTIWIKNFLSKYSPNQKQLKGVAKFLDKVKDPSLVEDFLDYNDTLDIPYGYPMDTHGVDKDKDKDKESNVADSKSDDDSPKYPKDSKPYQLASKLKTLIRENDKYTQLPDSSVKALQDWADSIRKMQEYGESANDDGASFAYEEIDDLIEFSQGDDFWKQNILSASKLRKQAGKLMQRMKEKDNSKRDDGGRPSQVTDADRKVAEKREEWMDNE